MKLDRDKRVKVKRQKKERKKCEKERNGEEQEGGGWQPDPSGSVRPTESVKFQADPSSPQTESGEPLTHT